MGDCRRKEETNHQQATRPESSSPRRSWLCLGVALAVVAIAVPLCAQQSKIYRDGNSWVEEITGTLPTTRELRVFTVLAPDRHYAQPRNSEKPRSRHGAHARLRSSPTAEESRFQLSSSRSSCFFPSRVSE